MKIFGIILLFCIGIYFLTKDSPEPRIIEVNHNLGKLNCPVQKGQDGNSKPIKGCSTGLNRAELIIRQSSLQKQ